MADLARANRSRRLAAALAASFALVFIDGVRAGDAVASAPASTPAPSASVARAEPQAVPTAADPVLEARMLALTGELRCLVCQNQTIADSHADLAADLRQEVRELIRKGRTDAEIRRYMTDRYGDFVLYKPPFKASTAALWLGPAALLVVAVAALALVISRRSRLPDDQFEPDPEADDDRPGEAEVHPTPRTGSPA